MKLPFDLVISLLGIYLKNLKILIQKIYMHLNIYDSIIYNSQDINITQVPINRQMDKKVVVYIYIGIFLTHKKE